jgi:hypothetical protein
MAGFILVKLEADVVSELIVTPRSLRAAPSSFQTTDFGRPIRVTGVIAPQGASPATADRNSPGSLGSTSDVHGSSARSPLLARTSRRVSRSRSLTLSTHNAAYMRINTDLFGLRSNTDPKPKEIPARWNRPRAESVAWKKFRAARRERPH